jgi:hypothetical protein
MDNETKSYIHRQVKVFIDELRQSAPEGLPLVMAADLGEKIEALTVRLVGDCRKLEALTRVAAKYPEVLYPTPD